METHVYPDPYREPKYTQALHREKFMNLSNFDLRWVEVWMLIGALLVEATDVSSARRMYGLGLGSIGSTKPTWNKRKILHAR